jgi:hypothetical protein
MQQSISAGTTGPLLASIHGGVLPGSTCLPRKRRAWSRPCREGLSQAPPRRSTRGRWCGFRGGADFGNTRPNEQRPRDSCLCRCSAMRFMSVSLGWSPAPALRGRCALGQTRSGLGVWVVRPRGSGASKAAGVLPFLRRRSGGGGRGGMS